MEAETPAFDHTLLHVNYGLTPAEIRVAVAIAQGRSSTEAAEALGVGVSTVRSHLKQVYAKTGVNSRTRFVQLMLALKAG